ATGDLGVAVASKFLAVGAVVPWARAGVGAVATQAYANTDFGGNGLQLLGDGLGPEHVIARPHADDVPAAVPMRQVGLVDAAGRSASFTGGECPDWAGGRHGPGYACQGNILSGPDVVSALASTFEHTTGDLAQRL